MSSPAGDLPTNLEPSGTGNKVARQALWWLCLGGVLFLLLQNFGLAGVISIGTAFLGLCFVIFIHELGHFAVAKWCDVHVEAFSIGFGPAVPGCSFRRGETLYKIAWFPLGGYVKMVGEGNETDEDDNDPRAFKNKSVWQRMAIFSAGVIMNMIFGLACFIFVYRMHGVDQEPAVIGIVDPSGPAWEAGVRTGAVIKQIGTSLNPNFEDLRYQVTYTSAGEKIKLAYELPGSATGTRDVWIEPRREKENISPIIGVSTWYEMKLAQLPRKNLPPVDFGSPAAAAQPPFQAGDWIIGMSDPDHDGRVTPLPHDPRSPNPDHPDYFVYRQRLRRLEGKPVVFQISRKEGDQKKTLDIPVEAAYHYTVGLRMRMGQITAVRDDSPAAKARQLPNGAAGIQARNVQLSIEGDILDEVEVSDGKNGKIIWSNAGPGNAPAPGVTVKVLDPVRLPDELANWAESVSAPRKVTLTVLRKVGHAERQKVRFEADWDDDWKDDYQLPSYMGSPMPIPGLGFAYLIDNVIEAVDDKVQKRDFKRGDLIKSVRFNEPQEEYGKFAPGRWIKLDPDSWAMVSSLIERVSSKDLTLKVERDNKEFDIEVTATEDRTWPELDRGLILSPDRRRQKADSMLEAITMGLRDTQRSVVQIYKNLQAIFTGRVSPKSVGGPILIATTAYSIASDDIYKFLRFLGMISVNLAVINFLPIPILDGGHMVFLFYEKLRGAPASENIRAAATYAGLFLILALMAFVWWVDLTRWF